MRAPLEPKLRYQITQHLVFRIDFPAHQQEMSGLVLSGQEVGGDQERNVILHRMKSSDQTNQQLIVLNAQLRAHRRTRFQRWCKARCIETVVNNDGVSWGVSHRLMLSAAGFGNVNDLRRSRRKAPAGPNNERSHPFLEAQIVVATVQAPNNRYALAR